MQVPWHRRLLTPWRREALRTTLWVVPALLCLAGVALFLCTYLLDRTAFAGGAGLPGFLEQGSPGEARTVLGTVAGALITVMGVLFSVVIVVLTLASQQFGPRMLRNFMRDLGTQLAFGAYVGTFVFTVLTLASVGSAEGGTFVPRLSIATDQLLLIVDVATLIYFVHHIAVSIQLPTVMAAISRDLHQAIDTAFPPEAAHHGPRDPHAARELRRRVAEEGAVVAATTSGYLQFVRRQDLLAIAGATDTVIELLYRPGHFVTAGLPLARVWPPARAGAVNAALARAHVSGSHRTITQDPVFPIDQLVEIALRGLSYAVNDTFTALTCIDWLADGLCLLSARQLPGSEYCDPEGNLRLVEQAPDYRRIVDRAVDKIRQSGGAMPPVAIRQIEALTRVVEYTTSPAQREVLARQARMLAAAAQEIPEAEDRAAVDRRLAAFDAAVHRRDTGGGGSLDVLRPVAG